jgi:hypothetical protein
MTPLIKIARIINPTLPPPGLLHFLKCDNGGWTKIKNLPRYGGRFRTSELALGKIDTDYLISYEILTLTVKVN